MSDAQAIEQAACDWVVRQPHSPEAAAEFKAWLESDPRHAGALLRAEAAWHLLGSAGEPLPAVMPAENENSPAPAWRRRSFGVLAGAVAGLAALFLVHDSGDRMITRAGEIRRVPLADGSVTVIDSRTELLVDLAPQQRRVTLKRGEAWFRVERDEKRPFVLDAGIAKVQVLGTAFAVERTGDIVRVSVTEGTVAAWSTDTPGATQLLKAGQSAVFRGAGAQPQVSTAPTEVERRLAWREGEIALDGQTLYEAALHFNEYNGQKIVVDGRTLASQRLVGLFRIGDPRGFAETAATLLDAEVQVEEGTIRLREKKTSSD